MEMTKKVQKAFTLAEVLITLSIIGVIAALTIPNLVQEVQDAQLKTAWKQAYSDLEQATRIVLINNVGSIKGICNDSNCLKNLYQQYFNYTLSCNSGSSFGNCWHENGKFWWLDGSVATGWGNEPGIVLNNGNLIRFANNSKTCTNNIGCGILRCADIELDINGFKGPNRVGKDIFPIHLLERGIKPYGTQEDSYQNKCKGSTGSNSGVGCSAEYLYK